MSNMTPAAICEAWMLPIDPGRKDVKVSNSQMARIAADRKHQRHAWEERARRVLEV